MTATAQAKEVYEFDVNDKGTDVHFSLSEGRLVYEKSNEKLRELNGLELEDFIQLAEENVFDIEDPSVRKTVLENIQKGLLTLYPEEAYKMVLSALNTKESQRRNLKTLSDRFKSRS